MSSALGKLLENIHENIHENLVALPIQFPLNTNRMDKPEVIFTFPSVIPLRTIYVIVRYEIMSDNQIRHIEKKQFTVDSETIMIYFAMETY